MSCVVLQFEVVGLVREPLPARLPLANMPAEEGDDGLTDGTATCRAKDQVESRFMIIDTLRFTVLTLRSGER